MINIGGNPLMILLAIVAALGGVGLYFVRNIRPELARDHDIFFSAIALVYGIIVLAFNFRMEITTQLAQVLVVGFGGWFAVETLVLRQAIANQARRSPIPPIVEDEPPPASPPNFRVGVDQEVRRESNARRMRGTANFDHDRSSELEGDVLADETPTRVRRPRRPATAIEDPAVIDIEESDVRPVVRRPRRDKKKSSNRRRSAPETTELEDF
ncbi:MAG: Ycf66 family protein [Pseudanabaenaceae cyanobacterium]